ncbi:MAG: helix-hairpin-helix domain-containing protein [Halanaerobiales bacterium]|nr:helix-hairpin-helix domain-containing protein [Halanaerobiales bacterium]
MKKRPSEQLIFLGFLLVIVIGLAVLAWQNLAGREIIYTGLADQWSGSELSQGQTETEAGENTKTSNKEVVKRVLIHVAGEVKQAGVYELPPESRVINALQAAGGATRLADLDQLNLAAPIFDGQKIYIPSITELTDSTGNSRLASPNHHSGKININQASPEELQQLTGIGPGKASNIVQYRRKIGGFIKIEQLLDVSGIGAKTLEKIRDQLTVY